MSKYDRTKARWCNGWDVGLVTRGRRFDSQPCHCLVISEIGGRISRVNYHGI